VQGVRNPLPLPTTDEAFFFVFAVKICVPYHSVTPFLSGDTLLRKILDPPLHLIFISVV